MRVLAFCIILLFLSGCAYFGNSVNTEPIEFSGIWIPKHIDWKSIRISKNDPLIKTAAFTTICLLKDSSIVLINSTQGPAENDSIAFAVEPGFKLFAGAWSLNENCDIDLIYMLVYSAMKKDNVKEAKAQLLKSTISIQNKNKRTLITKDGIQYCRTKLYTAKSLIEINRVIGIAQREKNK